MGYSIIGRYKGRNGTLAIGDDNLVFTPENGVAAEKEEVVLSIPFEAIKGMDAGSKPTNKMTVLVDPGMALGGSRHEFEVLSPYEGMYKLQLKMVSLRTRKNI